MPAGEGIRFERQPHGATHLYVVVRFDGDSVSGDPLDAIALTRGYWKEGDARAKAAALAESTTDSRVRYSVLPVRVKNMEP